MTRPTNPPICPYCNEMAELVDSSEVYSRSYGLIWLCRPCKAYVGIHKNRPNCEPLGTLADADLRHMRVRAHAEFDPLWKGKMRRDNCSKGQARKAGYQWLADQLGVEVGECHISWFDIEMCQRVIEVCLDLPRPRRA